ncbi:pectinesterase inhibitor 10-like [Lactuca sativa]|uniref:pectinesterase inhibitor 10-like n=1 Tax=Lactuca sativa TaxID=4236 RepID=UPI000CD837FA|nr:pectinesterase inhibitor 10-like [Lactuca sativa]
MQAALDEVEKLAKRGKKVVDKKEATEEPSSKPSKSKKRKAEKGSPRGNTPPRSPTHVDLVNDFVPTPPPSPAKTTIQVTVAPPPPSSTPLVSIIAPPPPVISTPITTTPLPPPIFSNTTFTSTPIITATIDSSVNVNTSDVEAETEEPPKITTEPLSSTPSSDSNPILRGDDFEFGSTYYSPYQIPSEEDESAPATKQHIDSVHEKLDFLLSSTTKYNDVVLKDFMDTTMNQYAESIDKCTAAIDDSTSLCKRATADVKDLIQDSQVFLDSLKESNYSLSHSLQAEQTKFETVRSDLSTDTKTFLSSINSRFEKLTSDLLMERQIKDDFAQ